MTGTDLGRRTAAELADWTRLESGVGDPRFSIHHVSRRFGLNVYTDDRLDRSGTLRQDHGRISVVVAPASSVRRRFTAAHELGHFLLAAVEGVPLAEQLQRPAVEQWCNNFASHLLLPRTWLRAELGHDSESGGLRGLLRVSKRAEASLSTTTLAANDGLGWSRRLFRWRRVGPSWQLQTVIGSRARVTSAPGADALFDGLGLDITTKYIQLMTNRSAVDLRIELFRTGKTVYGMSDADSDPLWDQIETKRHGDSS